MRKVLFSIAFTFFLFCFGCKHSNSPEELKAKFYKNEDQLNIFIKSLQSDSKLDSLVSQAPNVNDKFKSLENLYPEIYSILRKGEIKDASVHPNSNRKGFKWYFITTNWKNDFPIHLIYDPFDSVQTAKNYYNMDEVANETWGLGDNWFMFRWVKDKEVKD